MMSSIISCAAILFIFISTANANVVADFTPEEIADHNKFVGQISAVASDCLDATYADHLDFFNTWGVSKYYGDRNPAYATKAGLLAALATYGKPAELVDQLEPISCIGLAMRCLKSGFESVGMINTWDKIYAKLAIDKKFLGSDLQKNLIALGWQSYYWNPDPSKNAEWDKEDQELNPLKPGAVWNAVWGGHAYRYYQATKKGYYHEPALPVHDAVSLVGFKDVQPEFFQTAPFFIGIAHAGYHVFPGRDGEVIEAHSMRKLDSIENLEYSEFNPLANGGGPKWTAKERYRSGLIVIPNIEPSQDPIMDPAH